MGSTLHSLRSSALFSTDVVNEYNGRESVLLNEEDKLVLEDILMTLVAYAGRGLGNIRCDVECIINSVIAAVCFYV